MICCRNIGSDQFDACSEVHDDGGQTLRQLQCKFGAEEPVQLKVNDLRCACNDEFDDSAAELPLSGFDMTTTDEFTTVTCMEVHPPFRRFMNNTNLNVQQYVPVKDDFRQSINEDYVHRLLKFKDKSEYDKAEDGEAETEGSDATRDDTRDDKPSIPYISRALGDQDTESEQAVHSDDQVEVLCASLTSESLASIDSELLYHRGWSRTSLVFVQIPIGVGHSSSMDTRELYSRGWPRDPLWSCGEGLLQKCKTSSSSDDYAGDFLLPSSQDDSRSIPLSPISQKPQSSLLKTQKWLPDVFPMVEFPEPKIIAVL